MLRNEKAHNNSFLYKNPQVVTVHLFKNEKKNKQNENYASDVANEVCLAATNFINSHIP